MQKWVHLKTGALPCYIVPQNRGQVFVIIIHDHIPPIVTIL